MNEAEEKIYLQGQRTAYRVLLRTALSELLQSNDMLELDSSPDMVIARSVSEREDAIAQLRMACEDHGDNDWQPKLHLADIIEKHLVRHLE